MKRLCAILFILCFLMSNSKVVKAVEDVNEENQFSDNFQTNIQNEFTQTDEINDFIAQPVGNDGDDYRDIENETEDTLNPMMDDEGSEKTNITYEQKTEETRIEETEDAEFEDGDPQLENSWRFQNGELTIPKARNGVNSNAWEKVNGVYVNDKGEAIENALYKGIDVSHHQEKIDWEKVKADGIDFAIIRCGYGGDDPNQDDRWWEYNVSECERLGIPYGVYIYSYATSVEKASSEADHVLRLIKGCELSYPVYFDMEDNTTQNLGSTLLGQIAQTFCNKISAAGYDVGIYANLNWWNNYLTSSVFDNPNWSKWVAQYNSYCAYDGDYDMWQCTSSGSVDGINGDVDLNFWLDDWTFNEISVDRVSPQFINTQINITANTSGANNNLQYKFVWNRDGWKEWGVLKDFSSSNTAVWNPDKAGDYEIIVDINDGSKVVSKNITFEIVDNGWTIDSLEILTEAPYKQGKMIELVMSTGGDNENLQYKFVWQRDDWEEWGTIQNFSSNNTVQFMPTESGKYTFIVDITDGKGKTLHSQITCTVEKGEWNFVNIETDKPSPQTLETVPVNIQVNTSGDNGALRYKFVWSRNNWEEWGILRNFGSSNSLVWSPSKAGDYKITVDISDGEKTVTASILYTITDVEWDIENLDIVTNAPYKVGNKIELRMNTSGGNQKLQYKFVWYRDNWADWGVIQNFSNSNETQFTPTKSGEYTFIADIADSEGKTLHSQVTCTVYEKEWSYVNIETNKSSPQSIENIPINIQVNTRGDNEELQYKFVWSRNNWEEWGTLRGFGSSSSVAWSPKKSGDYTITVDINDGNKITTRSINYKILSAEWVAEDLELITDAPYKVGQPINMVMNVDGETKSLQYKFVWQRDNWTDWGVIQNFSSSNTAQFMPMQPGKYTFIADVTDSEGKILHGQITCIIS